MLFLGAFLLQGTLLNFIEVKEVTPNLMLGLSLVLGFLYNENAYAALPAAVFGLIYDMLYSPVLGAAAIPLVIAALIAMGIGSLTNAGNVLSMLVSSALGFSAYYALNWCILRLAGVSVGFMIAMKHVPWIGIYTLAFCTVLYLICLVFIKKRKRSERFFY